MASPMGMRSAVSVQLNMVAANVAAGKPEADADSSSNPEKPLQTSEVKANSAKAPSPQPINETLKPLATEQQLIEKTERVREPKLAKPKVSEPSIAAPQLAEDEQQIAKAEPKPVAQPTVEQEPPRDDQQTVQASNNVAVGVHQEPVLVKPLFAAPPTAPRYPTIARKRGQQGTVWIEVWLDENGKQTQIEISQSSGLGTLDESALAAVSDWQFKPHQVNGLAMASKVRVPIEFSLQ